MKSTILISAFIAVTVTTAIQLPNPEPQTFNHTHPSHSNHTPISIYKSAPRTMITLPGGVFVRTAMPLSTQATDADTET
ncbi:hypothetical protein OCU04_011017 [Sclerotinia nivalis]|uniref:Uncharacterized protein n=1 Tax=Sclerotinia nivalis TaxID=352851 RepID=A0A9X0ADF9_9HELO|nr:hypothetical protein OCU04_011017 [Sclerotinia nivalis]